MGSEGFEGNIEVSEQRNSSDWNKFLETTPEEWDPMQEASTSHKYNYEVEDVNALKGQIGHIITLTKELGEKG